MIDHIYTVSLYKCFNQLLHIIFLFSFGPLLYLPFSYIISTELDEGAKKGVLFLCLNLTEKNREANWALTCIYNFFFCTAEQCLLPKVFSGFWD